MRRYYFGYGPRITVTITWPMLMVMGVVMLAAYVIQAIGLMELAKKRGISNSWLAWLPFANLYLLGKVADDICYRTGKKKSYRKLLLSLNVTALAVGVLSIMMMLPFLLDIGMQVSRYGDVVREPSAASMMMAVLTPMLLLAAWVLIIIQAVFQFIALYQIYRDYAPHSAVLFLVLSIVLSGIFPAIALLIIKNKTPNSIAFPVGHWENGFFIPSAAPGYGYGYGAQPPVGNPGAQGSAHGFDPYSHPTVPPQQFPYQQQGFYQPPQPQQPPYQPQPTGTPSQPVPDSAYQRPQPEEPQDTPPAPLQE